MNLVNLNYKAMRRNILDFLYQVIYHAVQLCAQGPSWRVCGSSRRKQSEYEMEDRSMKNWAGLVTLVLALTACGKSLQVKAKPEEKAETPSSVDTKSRVGVSTDGKPSGSTNDDDKKVTTNDDDKKVTTNGDGKKVTTSDPAVVGSEKDAPSVDPSRLVDLFDGQLTQVSVQDKKDMEEKGLPYLNKNSEDSAIRSLEIPSHLGNVGHVESSNLVFRAVKLIPAPQNIKKVTRFALKLKGVNRHSLEGAVATSLQGQVICMFDTKVCSGDAPDAKDSNANAAFWADADIRNNDFAEIRTGVEIDNAKGHFIHTIGATDSNARGEIEIDLIKLFKLETVGDAEHQDKLLVEWIYNNSVEYTKNGYRKFRFVIANDTYIEGGSLELGFETQELENPGSPSDYVKGVDDHEAAELKAATFLENRATLKPIAIQEKKDHETAAPEGVDYELNSQKKIAGEANLVFLKNRLLGPGSTAKATKLGQVLALYADKIAKVRVVVRDGSDDSASSNYSANRANAVKAAIEAGAPGLKVESAGIARVGSEGRRTFLHIDYKPGFSAEDKTKIEAELRSKLDTEAKK